jgi:hypothetical protein
MIQRQLKKALEMLVYMENIRYAADNFQGLGWKKYNEQFRLKMTKNLNLIWATLDNYLWLLCVTPHPHA